MATSNLNIRNYVWTSRTVRLLDDQNENDDMILKLGIERTSRSRINIVVYFLELIPKGFAKEI